MVPTSELLKSFFSVNVRGLWFRGLKSIAPHPTPIFELVTKSKGISSGDWRLCSVTYIELALDLAS
jgi:hypothetical protein